jgi:hypothetical protein
MRNINVELDYNDGSPQTAVIGLRPDKFTNYSGRLTGSLKYNVAVKTWVHGEPSKASLSTINFINSDGGLDSLSDEDFTDCRIYENLDGARTLLATGKVDSADLIGEDIFRVTLKDSSKLLNIPLQSDLYPASEISKSDGAITNTYYGLEDVTRPIAIGFCKSIPPVLSNRSINEYACHDDDFKTLTVVYDDGIAVTATKHTSSFVLSTNPSGVIVADVLGQKDATVPVFGAAFKIEPVVRYIMTKASYTNYSTTDLDDLDTLKGASFNYYQTGENPRTINDILKWIMDSITGYIYNDSTGKIRFGALTVPSVTADVEINEIDIISGVNRANDTASNISTKFGGDKNWYVYNQDDIVFGATDQNKIDLSLTHRIVKDSATALHSSLISKEEIRDTLLNSETIIQQEATNIGTLWNDKRYFYSFDTDKFADIGETVQLTYSRFGLSSGANLFCVGYEIDFINNNYRLILWG